MRMEASEAGVSEWTREKGGGGRSAGHDIMDKGKDGSDCGG
jgi:hypothetical protein